LNVEKLLVEIKIIFGQRCLTQDEYIILYLSN